jgi:CheY-like chemotaxis protein
LGWLERRRSDGAAEDPSLSLLRQLVARHSGALVATTADGTVLAASPAAERLLSGDPGISLSRVAEVIAAAIPVTAEEVTTADGRVLERDYAPIESPGVGLVHLWEYRDITDRIRAEREERAMGARLRFLVNVGDQVLYSCRPNADHDRTFASENIRELLGYDARRWAEPGFWRRAICPDDAARVLGEMPALRERGQQTLEYRLRHENGRLVRVRDEMRLICDSDTRPLEIVGWLTEAHQRTAAGSEILHDFSNLLLVIAGHAHLLKNSIDADDPGRWHVNEIAAAAERASVLTDRVRAVDAPAVAAAPGPVPEQKTALPGRGKSARGAGETVLIVEDEDSVRVFTGRALAGSGYKVIEARRAEEALEIAARLGAGIQAVLSDVSMPGMSGCELAQRLAIAQPGIKVLLMSGYDAADLTVDGAASSLQFLQKPFTPDVLAKRLREVLDN